jgi:hypothetical protein
MADLCFSTPLLLNIPTSEIEFTECQHLEYENSEEVDHLRILYLIPSSEVPIGHYKC